MKSLRTAALYLAGGLAGGFALSAFLADDDRPARDVPAPATGAALERRIAELEFRIDSVVAANAELSDELEQLNGLLETASMVTMTERAERTRREQDDGAADSPGAEREEIQERTRSRFEQARRLREQGLAAQLTAAGFSDADAQHIETRVEELRVEAMQSRYDALRSGDPEGAQAQVLDSTAALRAELGDAQYERFLEATGRPTSVRVRGVLASSAAETAGVLSGDEIVSYDGERVFDTRDLNRLFLAGDPGEPVVVDVVRDGQPIQVVIARGPLGITSGRGRR